MYTWHIDAVNRLKLLVFIMYSTFGHVLCLNKNANIVLMLHFTGSYDGNQIIQWDYTGKDIIPFIHIGNKIYECHRGKDWKAKVKQEKKEARLKVCVSRQLWALFFP